MRCEPLVRDDDSLQRREFIPSGPLHRTPYRRPNISLQTIMTKQKRPSPAKSLASMAPEDDAVTQKLVELALDLQSLDEYAKVPDELKKKHGELRKLIRKCLHQDKDASLREALDCAREEDESSWEILRTNVEELSETVIFRRDQGPDLEVNTFVIPMFVHSDGGLRGDQCFQDEEAFELLRASLQEGGLESPDASVVLVAHAYHLDEIAHIGYSQLSAMVHEAFDSMTRKKTKEAPAIARSMSGWPENRFAPEDRAVELRFLLGFALKTLDDPFYKVPEKEAAADRYFEARALRFRQWAQKYASLVKRCLVTDGRDIDIDFLYQDLFHSGKATAVGELDMLQMMSDLQLALQERGIAPAASHAVMGTLDIDDDMLLRVNLYAEADGSLLASSDKPVSHARALQVEADDVHDALQTLGVKSVALAKRFEADGKPVDARPYVMR
jgi:hypothetical protein